MSRQKITTVGELKKFLNDVDNDIQVSFADSSCLPCRPYKWYIYKNAEEFIKEKIRQEYQCNYFKDMNSCSIKNNAIVIHAEF